MNDLQIESGLPALHTLNLWDANGSVIPPYSELENLRSLGLSSNTLESLEIPPGVESLDLSVSHWQDLSGLQGRENLKVLSLQADNLKSIDASVLANVEDFRFTVPKTLQDLQFLSGLTGLTALHLSIPANDVTFEEPSGLEQLERLTIDL